MSGKPRPFTGRHMLITMVAFFAVVIAANVTMAVLASTSFTGLVARNGYVASIDYARNEESHQEAAARGWKIALTAPGGIVTLTAHDADGAPLPATRTATFEPSGTTGEAKTIDLDGVSGTLKASEPLPPGHWVLRADVGPSENHIPWRSVVVVGQ